MQLILNNNERKVGVSSHNWRKIGQIYKPSGSLDWAVTHGANPTAEHLYDDVFRIYFSARDQSNRSSIGSIEIDLNNPFEINNESQVPILGPGELGMFDDCGASIGCIVPVGKRRFLYYMGWNLAVTVPWKNAIGLAISESPEAPFIRYSTFPILPLNEEDPFTISYPWVTVENGRYRMWYGSNLKWGPIKADMQHVLKYAESDDGITWTRFNKVIIDADYPQEYAICRPCVIHDNDRYWMWYCSRGERYRIFLAESSDGITWKKLGKDAGIDVSSAGWDEDMIEYPCVFRHKEQVYMLYCGAEYGKGGFGLAVFEQS